MNKPAGSRSSARGHLSVETARATGVSGRDEITVQESLVRSDLSEITRRRKPPHDVWFPAADSSATVAASTWLRSHTVSSGSSCLFERRNNKKQDVTEASICLLSRKEPLSDLGVDEFDNNAALQCLHNGAAVSHWPDWYQGLTWDSGTDHTWSTCVVGPVVSIVLFITPSRLLVQDLDFEEFDDVVHQDLLYESERSIRPFLVEPFQSSSGSTGRSLLKASAVNKTQ
ncbi:unnamed protein product [Pleuronectes platessa]|uniref:Uncharacterized protein n=1 Tax=Pleuronectes platessa TaxID=8262 RepID=A0A9N7VNA7_PLEPL|nr:unnamed protein product [Pleuronectes platessa]